MSNKELLYFLSTWEWRVWFSIWMLRSSVWGITRKGEVIGKKAGVLCVWEFVYLTSDRLLLKLTSKVFSGIGISTGEVSRTKPPISCWSPPCMPLSPHCLQTLRKYLLLCGSACQWMALAERSLAMGEKGKTNAGCWGRPRLTLRGSTRKHHRWRQAEQGGLACLAVRGWEHTVRAGALWRCIACSSIGRPGHWGARSSQPGKLVVEQQVRKGRTRQGRTPTGHPLSIWPLMGWSALGRAFACSWELLSCCPLLLSVDGALRQQPSAHCHAVAFWTSWSFWIKLKNSLR